MKNYVEISIGSWKKICPEEVVLMVANINYTTIHLENGNKLVVATTLKKLEERFMKTNFFFRSHKSFMVNLSFVESYNESSITLKNKFSVLLSRRKKEILKGKMN